MPGRAIRTASFVRNIATGRPRSAAAPPTRNATVTRSASSRPVARLTTTLLVSATVPSYGLVPSPGPPDRPVPGKMGPDATTCIAMKTAAARPTAMCCGSPRREARRAPAPPVTGGAAAARDSAPGRGSARRAPATPDGSIEPEELLVEPSLHFRGDLCPQSDAGRGGVTSRSPAPRDDGDGDSG